MGNIVIRGTSTKTFSQLKATGVYTDSEAVAAGPTKTGNWKCLKTGDGRSICGKIGCMDSSATNYDADATISGTSYGTCTYSSPTPPPPPPPPGAISGCTDKCATNYNSSANYDDGSCDFTGVIKGCTDPDAKNYDPKATCDDGSCDKVKLTLRQTRRKKLNLLKTAAGPNKVNVNNDFKKVQDYLKDNNCGRAWPLIYVQREPNPDNEPERLVLFGELQNGSPHQAIPVSLKGTDWGFYDSSVGEWQKFPGSNWCAGGGPWNESKRNLKDILMEEEENNSLSEMIDEKLREFNFYSANDKGKQKVVFTDEDREEISKEFDDLIKKYPEDIAFIRAVVIAKGEDKKSGEPIVRLGSYYNNSEIELPFNSQMNGLGKLLDGGIIYFTIINNDGPDYRDFKIVGGDKIPEVEFNDKDKEEIELDNYTHSHDEEMSEMNEPFEEVMKKKEQKGLASLLDGDLTNDLTKRQKEVLENLKKKGFKFEKPENADIYERVRVSSKEFNESIKAWKPKK